MKCTNCGASSKKLTGNCEYCQTSLPIPVNPSPAIQPVNANSQVVIHQHFSGFQPSQPPTPVVAPVVSPTPKLGNKIRVLLLKIVSVIGLVVFSSISIIMGLLSIIAYFDNPPTGMIFFTITTTVVFALFSFLTYNYYKKQI